MRNRDTDYGIMMGNHTFLVFQGQQDAVDHVRHLTGDKARYGEMAFSPCGHLHRNLNEPNEQWLDRCQEFFRKIPEKQLDDCWLGCGRVHE